MRWSSDEFHMREATPSSIGGTAVTLHIYTEDVERVFNQAVSAGATVVMPLMDAFGEIDMDNLKIPWTYLVYSNPSTRSESTRNTEGRRIRHERNDEFAKDAIKYVVSMRTRSLPGYG